MQYKNNAIYHNSIEVPANIVTASLVNYGDQSRFSAYLNGWITNLKTNQYIDIHKLYPFFLDGTCFIKSNIDFDGLIEKYWPTITSGVKKKLADLIKKGSIIKYQLFIVSVFDLDPNTSMKMLDLINNMDCSQTPHVYLEFLPDFKNSKFCKMLNIKSYNNFAKLIKDDFSWYQHLMAIHATTTTIWEFNSKTKIQMFYPLNDMAAYCNKLKSTIGKYKTIFNKYIHMYEFFDGLEIACLTVKIPRDSTDLANWGYDLNICVGGSNYVELCCKCTGDRLLYMLEKDDKPYVMAYVSKEKPIQIFLKNNKCLSNVNKELHTEIFKFGQAILKQDIPYLTPYISPLHLHKKATLYKERGWIGTLDNALSKLVALKS